MKASLIVLLALAITVLLRRRSAALRHWVLAAAIACAAIAPALERMLPAWSPFPPAPPVQLAAPAVPAATQAVQTRAPSTTPPSPSTAGNAGTGVLATSADLLAIVWTAGFAAGVVVLLIGMARLAWIASRARPADARWIVIADEVRSECGIRRPLRLLQSDHPSLLVTWGLLRPRIVLPAPAAAWSGGLVRTVLRHEIAHIQRGDWIAQVAASLLRALYWFNPIVWIACRRLRLESEHACDDAVIESGVAGEDYAAHLLDLARVLNHRRTWLPAPAMARPSSLERRISAMLNERLDRRPISRVTRGVTVVALLALTGALAAAQSGSVAGTVVDTLGAPVPEVKMTLTSEQTGERREARTTRTGSFAFTALRSGTFALQAEVAGFASSRQTVTVDTEPVQRHIALQIGTLEETVTVTDSPETTGTLMQTVAARPNPPCGPESGANAPVGGNIRPPRKIRDVKPLYPAHLRGTGTEGTVVMDSRIGLDGFVKDVLVRQQPNPDLVRAAIDAVSGWQFTSTLLNCEPMEVVMVVTVKFVHQP